LLLIEISVAVDSRHFCKAGRKKLKLDDRVTEIRISWFTNRDIHQVSKKWVAV